MVNKHISNEYEMHSNFLRYYITKYREHLKEDINPKAKEKIKDLIDEMIEIHKNNTELKSGNVAMIHLIIGKIQYILAKLNLIDEKEESGIFNKLVNTINGEDIEDIF